MRCVLVCDTYEPHKNSAANLLSDLVNFCSRELGFRFDVYTISHLDSDLQNPDVNLFKYKKDLKRRRLFTRAFYEFFSGIYFCFVYFKNCLRSNYDVVFYYNPTILQVVFILFLKFRYPKSIFVLILRDIFPDWAIELGIIRNKILKNILYFVKALNIKIADIVYCESSNKLSHVRKKFTNTHSEILYNWSNFKSITRKTNNDPIKHFIYAGNVGEAQDITSCVPFFIRLLSEGHKIDFYAEGRELVSLKEALVTAKNVSYIEPVSPQVLDSRLSKYDGGLVFLAQSLSLDNVPGKILTYLKGGLPVFGAVNSRSELNTIINDNNLGLVVDDRLAFCSDEYRVGMLRLCDELDTGAIVGQASKVFGVENAVRKILLDIENIKSKKAT